MSLPFSQPQTADEGHLHSLFASRRYKGTANAAAFVQLREIRHGKPVKFWCQIQRQTCAAERCNSDAEESLRVMNSLIDPKSSLFGAKQKYEVGSYLPDVEARICVAPEFPIVVSSERIPSLCNQHQGLPLQIASFPGDANGAQLITTESNISSQVGQMNGWREFKSTWFHFATNSSSTICHLRVQLLLTPTDQRMSSISYIIVTRVRENPDKMSCIHCIFHNCVTKTA